MICSQLVASQTDATAQKINAASALVNEAFVAVLDAEHSGANATSLLSELRPATNLLSQAENAYRVGDHNAAVSFAESAIPIAQQVLGEAQDAKESAIVSNDLAVWSTLVSSIVGIIALIVVLFIVWVLIKKYYIKRLMDAKPEATPD